jgi:hypothetical protein
VLILLKNKLKGATCDLHHLLIFVYNFNISGLTGVKISEQNPRWRPFKNKKYCPAPQNQTDTYHLSLISTHVDFL